MCIDWSNKNDFVLYIMLHICARIELSQQHAQLLQVLNHYYSDNSQHCTHAIVQSLYVGSTYLHCNHDLMIKQNCF